MATLTKTKEDVAPAGSESKEHESEMKRLLNEKEFLNIPKVGDVVKGNVISASKNEVKMDIPGYNVGVVRGREMFDEGAEYSKLKPGDEVEGAAAPLILLFDDLFDLGNVSFVHDGIKDIPSPPERSIRRGGELRPYRSRSRSCSRSKFLIFSATASRASS